MQDTCCKQTPMVERNRALSVRMTDSEYSMVNDLAERDGLSVADYVRLLLRKTHAEMFGAKSSMSAPKRSAKRP